jgi:hypothetical protein
MRLALAGALFASTPLGLAAQQPVDGVRLSPRLSVAANAIAARGDAQTGSGFGRGLEGRWQTAPGFTLVGSVGFTDLGTTERRPNAGPTAIMRATTALQTALAGAEVGRPAGIVRPYVRLLGGITRVTTDAAYVGYAIPALGGAAPEVMRFRTPIDWGTVSRITSTLVVGTGTRIELAPRLALDLNVSRSEARKTTWAVDPQIGNDVAEAPLTFRRRTALWVWQVGAQYALRK